MEPPVLGGDTNPTWPCPLVTAARQTHGATTSQPLKGRRSDDPWGCTGKMQQGRIQATYQEEVSMAKRIYTAMAPPPCERSQPDRKSFLQGNLVQGTMLQ